MNISTYTCLGALALAVCLTPSQALAAAQQPPTSPSGQPSSAPTDRTMDQVQRQAEHMDTGERQMARSGDTAFAMKAAQAGMAEVKTGQLAAEKAGDPDVKAFGQMMVDDHTKANDQLKAIAKEKSMTLPADIDPKHQAAYEKLSKLSGAEFDRSYVKNMVKDHEEAVKEFTKESNNGKDEKIKGFAAEILPTLQQHLDKIKGIQGKLSSSTSTK